MAQNVLVQKLEHLAVPNQVRLAVRSRHQDNHSRIDQSVPQLYEMHIALVHHGQISMDWVAHRLKAGRPFASC